ncbi:MAG: fumarate hydratase [Chloroflexi bacterium]|nr:fumarate hydratase [Chloroflexota bacterium]
MRTIETKEIVDAVSRLSQEANFFLPEDVLDALKQACIAEISPIGRQTLNQIIENAILAKEEQIAICQDCGTAVIYLEVGQDVHIIGGDLYAAVNEGVRQGYANGYLRKSMVRQPFSARINTRDNTPAIIHTDIVPGDRLKIVVMPKGGGSENMSRLFMLTPSDGQKGIIDAVIRAVDEAGSNPCPPVIVGVGIGGTAEKAMEIAKKALLRSVGAPNPDAEVNALEKELLKRVNALGIGPQGFGGKITALAVHIETFPAHIASMPLAVNLQCHVARHKEIVL